MIAPEHEIPIGIALPWITQSLSDGSALAHLVAKRLDHDWIAHLVGALPEEFAGDMKLDNVSRGTDRATSDSLMGTALIRLSTSGRMMLIVQDDLARRGDPIQGSSCFVGDQAIRWTEISRSSIASAVQLLRTGSSGYPLNAYITFGVGPLLGGTTVGSEQQVAIADSLAAIIVSVYDAEGYVLVVRPTSR